MPMLMPEDKVTINGYPRTFNHGADAGSGMTKLFCENCESQLFTKNTNRPGTLGIRAGSVEGIGVIKPSANIYTDSVVPTTPFDGQPPKCRVSFAYRTCTDCVHTLYVHAPHTEPGSRSGLPPKCHSALQTHVVDNGFNKAARAYQFLEETTFSITSPYPHIGRSLQVYALVGC